MMRESNFYHFVLFCVGDAPLGVPALPICAQAKPWRDAQGGVPYILTPGGKGN